MANETTKNAPRFGPRIASIGLVGALAFVAFVATLPTASAHVCTAGASCDGTNCPDDGQDHVHSNGPTCTAFCISQCICCPDEIENREGVLQEFLAGFAGIFNLF